MTTETALQSKEVEFMSISVDGAVDDSADTFVCRQRRMASSVSREAVLFEIAYLPNRDDVNKFIFKCRASDVAVFSLRLTLNGAPTPWCIVAGMSVESVERTAGRMYGGRRVDAACFVELVKLATTKVETYSNVIRVSSELDVRKQAIALAAADANLRVLTRAVEHRPGADTSLVLQWDIMVLSKTFFETLTRELASDANVSTLAGLMSPPPPHATTQ